jgi:hypothetical protein
MFDSFAASPSSDPIRRRFEKEQTTAPSELYCIVYCIPRIPTLPILLDNQSLGYLICRILLLPKKLRTVYICRGGVEEKEKRGRFRIESPTRSPSVWAGRWGKWRAGMTTCTATGRGFCLRLSPNLLELAWKRGAGRERGEKQLQVFQSAVTSTCSPRACLLDGLVQGGRSPAGEGAVCKQAAAPTHAPTHPLVPALCLVLCL